MRLEGNGENEKPAPAPWQRLSIRRIICTQALRIGKRHEIDERRGDWADAGIDVEDSVNQQAVRRQNMHVQHNLLFAVDRVKKSISQAKKFFAENYSQNKQCHNHCGNDNQRHEIVGTPKRTHQHRARQCRYASNH